MPMPSAFRFAPVAGALIACAFSLSTALAADAPPVKAAKPAAKAVKAAPAPVFTVPDAQPDQVKAAELVYYGLYDCEFQQTVTITQSAKHSAYVDVKHGKNDWLMKPVLSSTGAVRLEDVKGETLMVQISSKSMLLNVKTAHRIVDDCVSPKQRELMAEAKAAKAAAEAGTATATLK
jgi:predicted outer membrane lipoprotein